MPEPIAPAVLMLCGWILVLMLLFTFAPDLTLAVFLTSDFTAFTFELTVPDCSAVI